jgi:hypothetical protein
MTNLAEDYRNDYSIVQLMAIVIYYTSTWQVLSKTEALMRTTVVSSIAPTLLCGSCRLRLGKFLRPDHDDSL